MKTCHCYVLFRLWFQNWFNNKYYQSNLPTGQKVNTMCMEIRIRTKWSVNYYIIYNWFIAFMSVTAIVKQLLKRFAVNFVTKFVLSSKRWTIPEAKKSKTWKSDWKLTSIFKINFKFITDISQCHVIVSVRKTLRKLKK